MVISSQNLAPGKEESIKDRISVVNKKYHEPTPWDIAIHRGQSNLGNVFSHLRPDQSKFKVHTVATRDEAVRKNREWLNEKIASGDQGVIRDLENIFKKAQEGKVNLVCYCAPLRCHGDNLVELILNAKVENGKIIFNPLSPELPGQEKGEDQVKQVTTTIMHLRDHVVIPDEVLESGFRVISKDLLKKSYAFPPTPKFEGTFRECETWIKSPEEKRTEIQEQSIDRIRTKFNVGNHALDVSRPGTQQSMF